MPRYKITVEYDGSGFYGWQRQEGLPSIQQCLEEAVEKLCGQVVEIYGSGRTDAGVHAIGQVAHMDLPRRYELHKIMGALNFYLIGIPIVIKEVEPVEDTFHARFSATRRSYTYRIINRPAPPALDYARAWHVRPALDANAMHEAAQVLVGQHDFTSFRATECQAKSPIKTLEEFIVERVTAEDIHCYVSSRSFLHHQVRNMVGTLVAVGKGHWNAEDVRKALAAKDRRAAKQTAPAHGLYLTEIRFT